MSAAQPEPAGSATISAPLNTLVTLWVAVGS